MKKRLAFLFVIALTTLTSGYALDTLKVSIPFNFMVGGVQLPAGEYTVVSLGGPVIRVQNLHANFSAFVHSKQITRARVQEEVTIKWAPGAVVTSDANSNQPKNLPRASSDAAPANAVVFHKYGDRYFIAKMWERTVGREFPTTKEDRAQMLTASTHDEIVTLAAAH